MENQKIRNATPTEYEGIDFKSQVEKSVFRYLVRLGFSPSYESETFVCVESFSPSVPFFTRRKVPRKPLYKGCLDMAELKDITYTPDIIFMFGDIKVIIEVKGFENDVFPIKRKLFRKYLETVDYPVVYAEIFTIKQLKEFLDWLTKYSNENNL